MGRDYRFLDNKGLHFISLSVVNRIDVFIRNEYKEVLLDSWKYCMKEKGMQVHAWCIMTSHVHMIFCSSRTNKPEDMIRDMKSHTSRGLRKAITENPQESRKEWMLWMMERAGRNNSNNNDWQFWQQDNHPILLYSAPVIKQKLDYIHNNPVDAGFVSAPQDYIYSSARDYCGEVGILEGLVLL